MKFISYLSVEILKFSIKKFESQVVQMKLLGRSKLRGTSEIELD